MFDPAELINVKIYDIPLGRMVISDQNLCVFEYDDEFLKNGFSISPFYLPLKAGVFTAKKLPFNGLFGVFSDSLPDGWGQLLIDRYLNTIGINPKQISILDRLAIIGTKGMGAISYIPDNHIKTDSKIGDLDIVAKEIKLILNETNDYNSLEKLAAYGGSSGGARPKAFINHKGEPWIVKFPSSIDPKNIGEIEYQYSIIAKKCGINMTETALLNGKYFGIKRFDREDGNRIHCHTAAGLLYASHRFPSLDYYELLKATFILTKNNREVYNLFRLMIFNVLTENKDDHSKNFSFIYKDGNWTLSPAYDLVPNEGFNGNHSTTINEKGNPTTEDIFEVANKSGLNKVKAKRIFDEVYENCQEIRGKKF